MPPSGAKTLKKVKLFNFDTSENAQFRLTSGKTRRFIMDIFPAGFAAAAPSTGRLRLQENFLGIICRPGILMLIAAVALIAMAGGWGCSVAPGKERVQAGIPSANAARSMALLKFEGSYGPEVRKQLFKKLSPVKDFNLIDAAGAMPLEINLNDRVNGERIADFFEKYKADMLMAGYVSADIQDRYGTDLFQVKEGTGQYKRIKNESGKWVEAEIERAVLQPVPCFIRNAFLSIDFRIYDLKIGRMIIAGTVTETRNEKFAVEGEKYPAGYQTNRLPTRNQTIDTLSAELAARLTAKILPDVTAGPSNEPR
jgi:hypothetical protein